MLRVMPGLQLFAGILQIFTMVSFGAAALALLFYTGMASLGLSNWLSLPVQFGSEVTDAGVWVQIGLTILAVGLCVYLPANHRVMRLESSHRNFSIHMQDVARAYHAVHQADRDGTFQLSHEFDAVKERIAYLRDHPDLGLLEPDVLEVAAQMGVISRELAEIYSHERVDRARTFLAQRQEEIAAFRDQLDEAKAVANDIQNWAARVDLEEDVARSEIARLRAVLEETMPELPPTEHTSAPQEPEVTGNMISLVDRQAAE